VVDRGVMLLGDAAGLAFPRSGEGIRTAIESGLLAAQAIVSRASGASDPGRLYQESLRRRFELGVLQGKTSDGLPFGWTPHLAVTLMRLPWFVRRVVLDRWFLRTAEQPLSA